ncbi:uncharacterized protein LOC144920657 [Branchiostoma floridae x Branchiostoma belcheri]
MAPPTPAILTAPGSHTCGIDCRHGPAYAIFTALAMGSHTRPTIVEMNTSMTISGKDSYHIIRHSQVGMDGWCPGRVFRCRKLDPKVERQNRHSGGGLRGPSRADFDRGVPNRTGGGSTLCPVGSASSSVGSASSLVGTALTDVMLAKLIPMFFAAVAMAPLVVMVTGQGPSEEELQQAIAQATAENGAVSAGDEPEEDPFSGALNALDSEHHSTPEERELSRCATVLENVAKHFLVGSGRRYTIEALSAIDIRNMTSVCDAICKVPTCPTPAVPEFRSANGRCNNRNHPLWGSSDQPLRRMLEPEYGDGLATPRSNGRDGAPLPSARLVSTVMHEDLRKSSPVNTYMVMQFGQFLDHDITFTPNFQEQGLRCTCGTNCEKEERCFNINIPSVDPDFAGRPCLPFARSLSGPNEGCRLGRRQQLNQITAFVDASNVYGSSDEEIEELREHAGSAGSNQVTCLTGYERFQQNCFKAFPSQTDHSWRVKACMNDDGFLAMPKDAATNAFLVQLKNAVQTGSNVYIGLDDRTTEGQWLFADGTRLGSYNNWKQGEPNNGGDCVVLLPGADGKWDDTGCSSGYIVWGTFVSKFYPRTRAKH